MIGSSLLALLDDIPSDSRLFNPWRAASDDDASADAVRGRRERLQAHFDVDSAEVILVGEAPGYQGARISGLAFTSEALLLEGAIPRVQVATRLSKRERPWSEPSARIVWKTLYSLGVAERTCLFNACPIHPHEAGKPFTNRTPLRAEIELGKPILELICRAHPDAVVVGVGQQAGRALSALGIRHHLVRHPAYGGATEFAQGLTAALAIRKPKGSQP